MCKKNSFLRERLHIKPPFETEVTAYCNKTVADLGEGLSPPPPPQFLKKEETTEGRKASWAPSLVQSLDPSL